MERGGKGRRKGVERKGRNGKGTHSGLDPVPLLFCESTPMLIIVIYSFLNNRLSTQIILLYSENVLYVK